MSTTRDTLVELRDITKRYAGVQALRGISMALERGTIHGLVGENGAGKSTLGKIIGGAVTPTSGTVHVDGREVEYRSPRQALDDGLAVIQQELALVPGLTVLQNVVLGSENTRRGRLDRAAMRRRYDELEARAGFGLSPDAKVGDLSIAEQQKVEILRAVMRNARLIVMDEPTSSLARDEAEQLHALVRGLREDGLTIVYVSHFLEEVLELADEVTVFRDGQLIETLKCAGLTVDRVVRGMLGRDLTATFPDKALPLPDAPVVLSVDRLHREGVVHEISFDIRAGEIVGLAGLVGSGRTEVARAIFGADRIDRGTVSICGEPLEPGSPRAAIGAGIGFAPEDRKSQGLFLDMSQRFNATMAHLSEVSRRGVVRVATERPAATAILERLRVVPVAPEMAVRALSGGNQQKVMFAKWLLKEPRVLILDEPTRGIDIGAKRAIYDLITELAAGGLAVLVISSELEEVLGLAHRVLVMRRGRVVRELGLDAMSQDAIVNSSFGIGLEPVEEAVT